MRRLQRNLTIEFISQETRIQPRLIKAMEEEDWKVFPARVYLEGFLRKYAALLGLDSADMMRRLAQSLGQPEKPLAIQPEVVRKEDPVKETEDSSRRSGGILILFGILLVAGVYFHNSGMTKSVFSRARVSPSPPPEPVAAPVAAPLSGHKFVVRAKQSVWTRVIVDGRVKFEGILPPGTEKLWTGESEFRLVTGYPAAVDVFADEEPLSVIEGGNAKLFRWPRDRSVPVSVNKSTGTLAP